MDANQFREAAHAAVEDVIKYYESLGERRVVSDVSPGYLRPQLPSGPPQTSEPFTAIQRDIANLIIPGLTHWQSPNFMAYYPANASFPSILGEIYSATFTAPAFNWLASPACTELETVVLDWMCELLGLPECFLSKGEGGGVIQGTASEAIVVAMVAARERYLRNKCDAEGLEGEAREARMSELKSKLVALGSDQAHSSTQKGALIAGTKFQSVPTKMEDNCALRGEEVRRVIKECKEKGLEPYYLTVTMGTTGTCATDRFDEISKVVGERGEEKDIWVHVDAAYAGAALVLDEYKHFTKDWNAFDSFDMNMHKWLLTNFDASCFFVKRRANLTHALSINPAYLRNTFTDSGLVTDYRDWQIPLGRRFRSLKIWFVLRSYGIEGLQAHIRKHVGFGKLFTSLLQSRKDLFSITTEPAFSLNCFTALLDTNEVTKEVYERVNQHGEIFLTSTVVHGVYVIRVVTGSPWTEEKYVRRAFEILVQVAEEVLSGKEDGLGTDLTKTVLSH
ncbi:aromatic-L-amino-acid decarboxylase [Lineolata rhizophorae]|uniref:Aromatic-L-amino-acid decarboxylase n=1 Tax=Lineolata rhizophorae TaxID=578093 RepID=A0A6A6PDI5_9PEZI|nr:aromatic-L-amino-acid decarboxylase [Lineolata rhizophorae]